VKRGAKGGWLQGKACKRGGAAFARPVGRLRRSRKIKNHIVMDAQKKVGGGGGWEGGTGKNTKFRGEQQRHSKRQMITQPTEESRGEHTTVRGVRESGQKGGKYALRVFRESGGRSKRQEVRVPQKKKRMTRT